MSRKIRLSRSGPALLPIAVALTLFPCGGLAIAAPAASTPARAPAGASAPARASAAARRAAPVARPLVDLSAGLPPWTCPIPVERTLDNGLRVAVFPNSRVPAVHIHLLVPAGVMEEGTEPHGIAYLTSQMLRRGTSTRDAAGFLAELERLGGTLAAASSRDYATVVATFLSADLEAGTELVSDLVIDPVFTEDELSNLKNDAQRSLIQSRLNPPSVADEQIWSTAFGTHPYARALFGTPESVAGITREQVRTFYQEHWNPGGSLLVFGGDVTPERAFAVAQEWFGRWPKRGGAAATSLPVPPLTTRRIRIVDQPDAPATEVRIGMALPPANSKDDVALSLAIGLLGSGPTARLQTPEVRRRFGRDLRTTLLQLRDGGLFTCGSTVRSDSAGGAIRFLCDRMHDFATHPPAPAELERAQRVARNNFPMPFETMPGLMSQWMALEFLGQGRQAIDDLPARTATVKASDVADVAQRWLDPERAAIVLVGPAARLKPQFEGFGTVEVVHLDLPQQAQVPVDTTAATPERLQRGREELDRAIVAHGGLETLRGIHDSVVDADITIQSGGRSVIGHMTQVRKDPNRMVYHTLFETLESTQVLADSVAWSVTGNSGEVEEVDAQGLQGLRSSFHSDLPHLLLDAAAPGARVVYHGEDWVERTQVEVLDVELAGGERRRYRFDRDTHLLFAMDVLEIGTGGQSAASRRLYRDYRLVQGVRWPFLEERQLEGETAMKMQIKTVTLNSGVQDKAFAKPKPPAPTEP